MFSLPSSMLAMLLLCMPGIFLDNSFYGWDWMNVWRMDGCNKSCVQVVHQLSISDVLKFHDIYTNTPKSMKKQWLLNYFHINTSGSETSYSICGKSVCFEVWLSTLGICQSYYYKVRAMFTSGVVKLNKVCK